MEDKISITDFINFTKQLKNIDCCKPSDFCFLPENIETAKSVNNFVFSESTPTIQKLFKKHEIPEEKISDNKYVYRHRHSVDLYGPIIFISYSLLTENSSLISIALNVISNYVFDYFKGSFGTHKVKFEFVVEVEENRVYKKINYEGGAEGLKNIENIIKTINKK
jgi:hypothetical protein